ncbi:MAG: hypothetical protein JWP14_552 [Frankiales bacterium]|jgi:hypothetical protein|nr:hypothetical protein [Frankiales bacterium]
MSWLLDRLAALDRRVLGSPGVSKADEYLDGYDEWWSRTQPTAKWAALLGYAAVTGAATGGPYLLLGYQANRAEVVIVGVTYWPLIWHFYLRHRLRER